MTYEKQIKDLPKYSNKYILDFLELMREDINILDDMGNQKHTNDEIVIMYGAKKSSNNRVKWTQRIAKKKFLEVTGLPDEIPTIEYNVADAFALTISEIYSKRRKREMVSARCVIHAYDYYVNFKSKSQIARDFDLDHASIIHSLKRFNELHSAKGSNELKDCIQGVKLQTT